MSDVVSSDELNTLAAEFVLGTLDYEERKGAAALLEVDYAFRGIVRIWERRLGELHLMVEAVEPDQQLWARIRPKIGGIEQVELAIPSHTAEHAAEGESAAPAFAPAAVSAEPSSDAPPVEAPATAPSTPAPAGDERRDEATPSMPMAETAVEPAAPVTSHETMASETPQAVADAELRLAELAALLPPSGQEQRPGPASPPLEASASEPLPSEPPPSEPPPSEPPPSESPAPEPVEEALQPREPEQVSHGFVPPPPMITRSAPVAVETVRRTGRGWIAATLLMGLVAIGLAGLIGAWRYFPERLPEPLRINSLLNLPEPPPPALEPPPPPPPPFDE